MKYVYHEVIITKNVHKMRMPQLIYAENDVERTKNATKMSEYIFHMLNIEQMWFMNIDK